MRWPRTGTSLACAAALVAAGCGGDDGSSKPDARTGSPASGRKTQTGGGEVPPGRVRRAARSNANREIPSRFGRAVQLPYRSTVLFVTPIKAFSLDRVAAREKGRRRAVGIVVGIRNIGVTPWKGSPSGLSRLGVSAHERSERDVASRGASVGPCPQALIKSRRPVEKGSISVPAGRTVFECIRFLVPRGMKPILYKFASQSADWSVKAAEAGRGYGVWALPGTLVEKCRYEPSMVRGHCHGLEADE